MIASKRTERGFNPWWICLSVALAWAELEMMTGWGFVGAILCLVLSADKK